jgi:hypothetical protein
MTIASIFRRCDECAEIALCQNPETSSLTSPARSAIRSSS